MHIRTELIHIHGTYLPIVVCLHVTYFLVHVYAYGYMHDLCTVYDSIYTYQCACVCACVRACV